MISRISLFAIIISILALSLQVGAVARFSEKYQFDFRAYYFAPILLEEGKDPYSRETVYQTSEEYGLEPAALPFLYAPISIYLFKPISTLDFGTAYISWLILQVISIIAALSLLVVRFNLPLNISLPIFVFGLNGTIPAAIRHGQLEIITLFLLISALTLSRKSLIFSAALIVLASVPKIWLTPLSFLLAVPPKASRVAVFLGTIATILVAVLSAYFWAPALFASFQAENGNLVFNLDPRGPFRGSFVNFIATVEALTPLPFESRNWIYAFWIIFVGIFSLLAIFNLTKKGYPDSVFDIHLYSIVALALCIVSPRMLVYQWCIALPGIILAITLIQNHIYRTVFCGLIILPTIYISQYGLDINVGDPLTSWITIPWGFSNIILTSVAWYICVRATFRPSELSQLPSVT